MGLIKEIYLNNDFVSKDEWKKLIKIVSNYNGLFRSFKIIITNDKNNLRYFIETKCSLPPTINNLSSFLLKPSQDVPNPKAIKTSLTLPKSGKNIVDLINYNEIKNKGTLIYLEIKCRKLSEDKVKTRVTFYLNQNDVIKKYILLLAIPANILSADFDSNKRFYYKKAPKYLEINKILHLLNSDTKNAILSIDTFPYLQGNFYLNQNNFSFDKHSLVIGSSGTGKSKFISMLINNINKNESLRQKYKVVVIDPHAALENDIGGLGQVIDFKNSLSSIDLFINNSDDIIASTELLLDLLKSLLADQYNSKLERVLRHAVHLLLTASSFNFRNLRKLLLDTEYRNSLINYLKNSLPISVIDFFLSDFNDLKTKSYSDAIAPIIGFIDEMEMIPVFNNEEHSDNLKDVIHDNFLTLFSLNRTSLGDKVTKTIAGLLIQQLLTIVQRQEIKEHIIFIIDEVAVVENPILARYLSESRKYNLSLVLAGQYLNQISDGLKNAIFANVINYFIFRISKLDATLIVDNFNMKIPLDDSKEQKIKLLTELQNRECIARIEANGILMPAFKGITLDYTSVPRIKPVYLNSQANQQVSHTESNKIKFNLNCNIKLKDILISNSTNKRGV